MRSWKKKKKKKEHWLLSPYTLGNKDSYGRSRHELLRQTKVSFHYNFILFFIIHLVYFFYIIFLYHSNARVIKHLVGLYICSHLVPICVKIYERQNSFMSGDVSLLREPKSLVWGKLEAWTGQLLLTKISRYGRLTQAADFYADFHGLVRLHWITKISLVAHSSFVILALSLI